MVKLGQICCQYIRKKVELLCTTYGLQTIFSQMSSIYSKLLLTRLKKSQNTFLLPYLAQLKTGISFETVLSTQTFSNTCRVVWVLIFFPQSQVCELCQTDENQELLHFYICHRILSLRQHKTCCISQVARSQLSSSHTAH